MLLTRCIRAVPAVLTACLAFEVSAQHATAYDIEDGKRVYDTACANCHGPDGNLIAGIDFGRGVYRRAFGNDELAAIVMGGIPSTPWSRPPRGSSRSSIATRSRA